MGRKNIKFQTVVGDEDSGGTWIHRKEGRYFLLTTMPHWNEEADNEWYGYARILHSTTPVEEAIQRGYGRVIGYTEQPTGFEVKQDAETIVSEYLRERATDHLCPLPRKAMRPLSYVEKKRRVEATNDSFEYLKGYLDGSRGRTPKLTSQPYKTGFSHGVSYTRGEAEPPTWLMEIKDARNNRLPQ